MKYFFNYSAAIQFSVKVLKKEDWLTGLKSAVTVLARGVPWTQYDKTQHSCQLPF